MCPRRTVVCVSIQRRPLAGRCGVAASEESFDDSSKHSNESPCATDTRMNAELICKVMTANYNLSRNMNSSRRRGHLWNYRRGTPAHGQVARCFHVPCPNGRPSLAFRLLCRSGVPERNHPAYVPKGLPSVVDDGVVPCGSRQPRPPF